MMETLRGWLLGLTAAALAVSLLTAMLPLPYGASLDVERDQVLSDYMAQELGIPVSRQSWQPEE